MLGHYPFREMPPDAKIRRNAEAQKDGLGEVIDGLQQTRGYAKRYRSYTLVLCQLSKAQGQ